MSEVHGLIALRIIAIVNPEQTLRFDEVPRLGTKTRLIRCKWPTTRLTYQEPNRPHVYRVVPSHVQQYFRGSVLCGHDEAALGLIFGADASVPEIAQLGRTSSI
jgi:hypothetical protein